MTGVGRHPLPFPFRSRIDQATGTSLPGEALVDPSACAARNVEAFTERGVAHFASSRPPLAVAAHEAVHVLQHRGITNDAILGAEGHADVVAQRMVNGELSPHLIGQYGNPVAPVFHAYNSILPKDQDVDYWQVGSPVDVADTGAMAAVTNTKRLWAEPSLIQQTSKKLEGLKSALRLEAGSEMLTGALPKGGAVHTLARVLFKNLRNNTSGDNMQVIQTCDLAAMEMMGGIQEEQKQYTSAGSAAALEQAGVIYTDKSGKEKITDAKDTRGMAKEVLDQYGGAKPEAIAETANINEYVLPEVGEAYIIRNTDKDIGTGPPHHFAAVIMMSGDDRVTLEAQASGSGGEFIAPTATWAVEMYGTKKGQTFHEVKKHAYGANPVTMKLGLRREFERKPYVEFAKTYRAKKVIDSIHGYTVKPTIRAMAIEFARLLYREFISRDREKVKESRSELRKSLGRISKAAHEANLGIDKIQEILVFTSALENVINWVAIEGVYEPALFDKWRNALDTLNAQMVNVPFGD